MAVASIWQRDGSLHSVLTTAGGLWSTWHSGQIGEEPTAHEVAHATKMTNGASKILKVHRQHDEVAQSDSNLGVLD